MSRTLLICGYGPGISHSVAKKWGKAGYRVAVVARNRSRLNDGVASLADAGVTAQAFPCDLSDADAVRAMVAGVHSTVGPIDVIHWNAFRSGADDLTTATTQELRDVLDVSLFGFLAAVQETLPDLRATKGAVLVTGGGFGADTPENNEFVARIGVMGGGIAKGVLHRAASLLHYKLADEGIYVGEVVVNSLVKGTAFDSGDGSATLDPHDVADRFWEIFTDRTPALVDV